MGENAIHHRLRWLFRLTGYAYGVHHGRVRGAADALAWIEDIKTQRQATLKRDQLRRCLWVFMKGKAVLDLDYAEDSSAEYVTW